MSLNFENASILSLEKQNNYFGSEYIFSCEKNISVQGFFYAGSNTEGVKEIQQDLDAFVSSTDEKLHDVIINGHNFGKGKVNSFSSGSGNSVRVKEYNVDITIFESGDLSDLTSETYMEAFQGLISDTNRKFIREFSENFSFSKNDGAYQYTHDLSIQFYDHGDSLLDDPIVLAKNLAKTILETDVDFGFLDSEVSGFYSLAHKKYFSETYNKVTKTCNFSENYTQAASTDQLYSVSRSHSLEVPEDGIMNITEEAEVDALTKVSASVLAGYVSTELSGAFSRCDLFVTNFNDGLFTNSSLSSTSETDFDLVNQPIDISKSLDHFSCKANYSVTYNNSENTNVGYITERTISADLNDEIATLRESGSVVGLGGLESEQYTKALNGYKSVVEPGIATRLGDFYSSTFPTLSVGINKIASSFNSAQNEGSLDYSVAYSNDPSRSDSNFKSINTSEDLNLAVTYKNDFKVLASGQAKEQYKGLTPTTKSVNVQVSGKRETSEADCKTKAVELANSFSPTSMLDAHINSLSYNFNAKEKVYSLDIDWSYYEDSATLCSNSVSISDPLGKVRRVYGLEALWRMDQASYGAPVRDLYGRNDGGWVGVASYESGKYREAAVFTSGYHIDFGRGDGCPVFPDPCTQPLPVLGGCPTPSVTQSLNETFPTPTETFVPGVFPTPTLSAPFATPSVSASISEKGPCYEPCPACGWDQIFTSKIFSISLWYKPTVEGRVLLQKFDTLSPPTGTDRDNSFILSDGLYTQADGSNTTFSKGNLNSWNHLVITCSDGSGGAQNGIYVYLNNSKISTITSPVFDKSNETLLITGENFEGSMDDLRIYSSTLSPFEVSLIFNAEDRLPSGLSPYVPSTPTETP